MVRPDERRENVKEEKDGTLTISVKEPREEIEQTLGSESW